MAKKFDDFPLIHRFYEQNHLTLNEAYDVLRYAKWLLVQNLALTDAPRQYVPAFVRHESDRSRFYRRTWSAVTKFYDTLAEEGMEPPDQPDMVRAPPPDDELIRGWLGWHAGQPDKQYASETARSYLHHLAKTKEGVAGSTWPDLLAFFRRTHDRPRKKEFWNLLCSFQTYLCLQGNVVDARLRPVRPEVSENALIENWISCQGDKAPKGILRAFGTWLNENGFVTEQTNFGFVEKYADDLGVDFERRKRLRVVFKPFYIHLEAAAGAAIVRPDKRRQRSLASLTVSMGEALVKWEAEHHALLSRDVRMTGYYTVASFLEWASDQALELEDLDDVRFAQYVGNSQLSQRKLRILVTFSAFLVKWGYVDRGFDMIVPLSSKMVSWASGHEMDDIDKALVDALARSKADTSSHAKGRLRAAVIGRLVFDTGIQKTIFQDIRLGDLDDLAAPTSVSLNSAWLIKLSEMSQQALQIWLSRCSSDEWSTTSGIFSWDTGGQTALGIAMRKTIWYAKAGKRFHVGVRELHAAGVAKASARSGRS